MSPMPNTLPTRRRWLRFNLQMMFAGVAIFALLSHAEANRRRETLNFAKKSNS